jgi:hypothetical protein
MYQATIVKENDVKHMMSKVSDNSDAKNVLWCICSL